MVGIEREHGVSVHSGQSWVAADAGGAGSWDLVAAAQGGDREAFGRLYQRYAGPVGRFLGARVPDRSLSEDLTSETFARALCRIDSVRDQGRDVGAWFTTIARNLLRDEVKSSRYRLEEPRAEFADRVVPVSPEPSPEQAVIRSETHAEVHRHLAGLPAAQRECLQRRFLRESSVAETAAAMGRGVGAVKALQHRGLRGLRAALDTADMGRVPGGQLARSHTGHGAAVTAGPDPAVLAAEDELPASTAGGERPAGGGGGPGQGCGAGAGRVPVRGPDAGARAGSRGLRSHDRRGRPGSG